MGIGLSGMVSGLDTDAIVKAMVSGQQAKATKVENKITLNKWTKEAWSGLNTKIYSFYTKYASKLRLQSTYLTRTASSSNESIAKATASSGAAVGTHTLKVKSLASSQYVTGGQLKAREKDAQGNLVEINKKANYNKNSKLMDMGVAEGTIITITGKKDEADKKEVKLEVTKDTTVNNFLNACKDAGLTASFDTGQQRFFISSSESGEENAFSITTNNLSVDTMSALNSLEEERTDGNGKVIKLIDTSILTAEEKKNYEEAMATIRKNMDMVCSVIEKSETTTALSKTEQGIMDAVNVVKDTAKRTYAVQTATNEELEKIDALFENISNLHTNAPDYKLGDLNGDGTIDKDGGYSSLDYTYVSLANKAKANLETGLRKQYAETTAREALRDKLNSITDETEKAKYLSPDTDLLTFTKENVDAAKKTKETLEAKGLDKLTEEEKSKLTEATKLIDTWELVGVDGQSIGSKYTQAYTTNDTTQIGYTQENVLQEMKNILINTDVYKNNVVKRKEEILASKDDGTIAVLKSKADEVATFLDLASFEESNEENYILEEQKKLLEQQNDIFDTLKALVNDPTYAGNDSNISSDLLYVEAIEELKEKPDMVDKVLYVLEHGSDGIEDEDLKNNLDTICNALKDVLTDAGEEKLKTGLGQISVKSEQINAGLEKLEELKQSAISCMGLGNIDGSAVAQDSNTSGMVVVKAEKAVFTLDGAEMEESSNEFTVNGITLNLTGKTVGDEEIQITVGKDTESCYKVIKEAIDEYNKLIEEMNTLYNANSARGYDPLTDEQKEAMSETDIENWEKKIKDSLLRRDDTLGTLLSSMRNSLATSYKDDDGKIYSLSTYGIVTGNYTEKGKLHIYGNEDDGTYATYEDRLKKALEDDPEQVMEVMTKVFGNLYETMTEKCAKTEISSALTFYNDKQYNNLLKDYEDDLDILEDRIKELEDRYYKQFTAMEKAMSTLQNQSNSLASLLGTGA